MFLVLLFVLLFLFPLFLGILFGLGELNIIGHDLVGKHDPLVRPPDPRSLRFDVDPSHIDVVQQLLIETGRDVGLGYEGQAEVQAGLDFLGKG